MAQKSDFDPDKDLVRERFPESRVIRMMRCLPCGEVIYEVKADDPGHSKRVEWKRMALHMCLYHGAEVLDHDGPDLLLRMTPEED